MEHATLRVRRWDDCDVMFVDEAGVCRSYGEYWAPPGMLGGAPCLVIAALAPQCFRLDKTATDWVVEQGARTYLIESRYRHNTVDVYLLDPGYYFYPRRDYARTNAGYSDPEAKSVELYQDHDRYKMMTAAERAERAEGERAVRAERAARAERAERERAERAERAERERERERVEQAERAARAARTWAEWVEQVERERAERSRAEQAERAERTARDRVERDRAERERAERAEREQAERAAKAERALQEARDARVARAARARRMLGPLRCILGQLL